MTRTIDAKSRPRLWAKLSAGLAISVFLLLGAFVAPASAGGNESDHHWNNNYNDYYNYKNKHYNGHNYNNEHYSNNEHYNNDYNHGYGNYPPPVVYGPGIGINLPGISIGIQ